MLNKFKIALIIFTALALFFCVSKASAAVYGYVLKISVYNSSGTLMPNNSSFDCNSFKNGQNLVQLKVIDPASTTAVPKVTHWTIKVDSYDSSGGKFDTTTYWIQADGTLLGSDNKTTVWNFLNGMVLSDNVLKTYPKQISPDIKKFRVWAIAAVGGQQTNAVSYLGNIDECKQVIVDEEVSVTTTTSPVTEQNEITEPQTPDNIPQNQVDQPTPAKNVPKNDVKITTKTNDAFMVMKSFIQNNLLAIGLALSGLLLLFFIIGLITDRKKVWGKVVSSKEAKPLKGVMVTILKRDIKDPTKLLVAKKALTNSEGIYRTSLKPGNYYLTVDDKLYFITTLSQLDYHPANIVNVVNGDEELPRMVLIESNRE